MAIERIGQLTAEDRILTYVSQPQASVPPTLSSTLPHTGAYSYQLPGSLVQIGLVVPSPVSAYRMGYWMYHSGIGAGDRMMLYRVANGISTYESANIGIRVDAINGNIEVVRPQSGTTDGWAVLATTTIPASLSSALTWTHYGITHAIHATDGFLSLYINGVLALSLTGDTRLYGQGSGTPVFATTAAYAWGAGAYQSGGVAFASPTRIDDLYLDSYVGEADAPVPARIFDVALADGAGADSEWTPDSGSNYEMIDDNPNDGDTTNVKALSAGLDDLYTFGNITVPTDHRIVAVLPTIFAKRLDSEIASTIKAIAYDGANTAESAELELPMDYANPVFSRMTAQPDALEWNETDFNAMQFGIRSSGTF